MKKIAEKFADLFRKNPNKASGQVVRGRVHRISRVAGGDLSVIIRFGMEEPGALRLLQGDAVWVCGTIDRTPPASTSRSNAVQPAPAPAAVPVLTDIGPAVCTCGTIDGHPHEPECPWWFERDAAAYYSRNCVVEAGRREFQKWEELDESTRKYWRDLFRIQEP